MSSIKKRKKREDPEEGYISPVEQSVITRKELRVLKRQRRIARRKRKKERMQAVLELPVLPPVVSLPDISESRVRARIKVKKEKDQQDSSMNDNDEIDEKESVLVREEKSALQELKSMSEIVRDYPHLGLNAKEEPICDRQARMRIKNKIPPESSSSSSSSESSSTSSSDENNNNTTVPEHTRLSVSARRKIQLQTQLIDPATLFYHQYVQWDGNDPYMYPEFKDLVQEYTNKYGHYEHSTSHLIAGEVSNSRWKSESNRSHVVLEKRTAHYESLLLREHGKFFEDGRWVYYPPCKNMHQCVGWLHYKHIKGLHMPILLMSSMPEQEYKTYIDNFKGDVSEIMNRYASIDTRQPCVLCYRYTTQVLIFKHALFLSQGKPTPLQRPSHEHTIDDHIYDMQTGPIQTCYNLKNETNGYDGNCMMDPSHYHYHHNNTLHFQPFVRCSLDKLFGYQDPVTLRRIVSQEALVWKVDNVGVEPELGESVASFLQSNKQQVGKNQHLQEEAMANLLKQMVLCLLQRSNPTVDFIEQGMTSIDLPERQSYACALLYDAYLLSPLYSSTNPCLGSSSDYQTLAWSYVRCDFTLSSLLDRAVHNMAFFSPLADVVSPLGHLLTKMLVNARCQHRDMDKGVARMLIQRRIHKKKRNTHKTKSHVVEYDDQVLVVMKQVVLCALLGNFPSDAQHGLRIADPNYRYLLYYLFHDNRRFDPWIVALFKHSNSVLAFCVRRYMVHVLETNPASMKVLREQFHFEEYRNVTMRAMREVQRVFATMLSPTDDSELTRAYKQCLADVPLEPSSIMAMWGDSGREGILPVALQSKQFAELYAKERESSWDDQRPYTFHTMLQKGLISFELDYRKLSFSRPYTNIALLLRPLRNDYPLVPVSGSSVKTEEQEQEQEPQPVINTEVDNAVEDEEEHEQNNYMFPRDQPHKYLNVHQVSALSMVISCCGPVGFDGPIQRILDFFPYFGVHEQHTKWLKELFEHYQAGTKSNESIKLSLGSLRIVDPHAYNLLQLCSIMLDQAQRRFRLVSLPLHVRNAQAKLLSNGRPTGIILRDQVAFVFCPVCCHVYSNVSDHNSVYKHSYAYGYRDVAVDYLGEGEGRIYCTNHKCNSRGKCGEYELVRIPLVGRILWLRSKFYMFCAHCGTLMAFDTKQQHYTAHTANGPCCVKCTRALVQQSGSQTMELLESNYKLSVLGCDFCKSLPNPPKLKDRKSVHMYGRDHFLCSEHYQTFHSKIVELMDHHHHHHHHRISSSSRQVQEYGLEWDRQLELVLEQISPALHP